VGVYVGETANVNEMTEVLAPTIFSRTYKHQFNEETVDLSAFAGKTCYIAFRHQDYDKYVVFIDDVTVYTTATLPYVNVTGVTLAQTEGVLTVGETLTLTATVAPDDATDKSVTWTTSDASVATVDGNGVVTAQGLGKATITATATNGTADTSDDVTATCTVNVYPWAGSGTADDPFQIQNVDDWNTLAANVTGGETYSGIYFKMTDDIIGVTTRTGKNSLNPFSGTFDGQGHTMNLNIYTTTTDDVTSAPFGSISGATIKNLHITGSETTTAYMRAASIAGFAANSTITNCWSEVALTSGYNKDIDCGAFVATVIENSSLTLNGCLFTGTITYTNAAGYEGGGMVGWTRSGGTATLNDCLFAPTGFTVTKYSGHYMFVGGKKRGVLNNCYYNDVAAATSLTKEGKQAFSIVKGDDVSSLAISGEGTEYSVSGITAYATGIKYNDVYYAGSGEAVGLTLSHADREGYTFSTYAVTGGGTLADATTDTPTLTMSEADAVVSAMWLLPTDETGAYLISSAGDWNSFCYDVNNGNAYSGKTVKLTQDISEAVNTTAGTSEAFSFQGTFDGQAHTLNVNITDNSNSPAPFRYIKNATIRNLVVTGNITSSQKHVAGLAKATYGDVLIENCNVAATISGARYMGGFIGHSQDAQVTINGCVFSGTLSPTGSDYTGGFICWGEGVTGNTMAVTNSLFCGTLAGSGSSKFHPIGFNYTPANPTRVFTNTYYTIAAKNIDEDTDAKSFVNGLDAESKGKQAYALATAPANLGGLVQDFGVMTAYENGILCGDIYYVAPADITLNETEAGKVTAVDGYFSNVTLTRTLQTGGWNTFCAPFSTATPSGWTVKELSSSEFNSETGVLTLNFADAESIEAGKPYLVKVTANVENPTFDGVTISSTTTTTETTAVDFVPVMNPTNLTGGDKTVLFVSGGNKLTYPSGDGNINGFRAYFQLKGDAASQARAFRMSFDDNMTGIITVLSDEPSTGDGIYTLDGRRIEGQPTQKGVYIVNGKKTIIK
ncbi:MAG: Ig domain-containing protein, partial [Prevotella sp.]|nr:Ig domain-containing protein [Prevotella sp.]